MRLTKKQSKLLAVGILAVFFLVVFSLVQSKKLPSKSTPSIPTPTYPSGAPTPIVNLDPEKKSQFSLTDFNRSEVKDGVKVWEIKASLGEYFPGQSALRLTNSVLWLYSTKAPTSTTQQVTEIHADSAVVTITGTTLDAAELTGHIKILYGDNLTMTTERAIFDKQTSTVVAPEHVTISGTGYSIEGEGLTLHTETRNAVLSKNVRTLLNQKEMRRAKNNE